MVIKMLNLCLLESSPLPFGVVTILTALLPCVTQKQKNITGGSMSTLVRFGVSLDSELLSKFDSLIKGKNYTNRSEAVRDLIRQELISKEWEMGAVVAGAITLIYDHHKRDVLGKVIDIQHEYQSLIISTQHIHLDHHNCLEIVAVQGRAEEVKGLAATLKSVKGVRHGSLNMASTGKDIL
jgi:CopG family nickel-responsive transcriptional regulator